MRKIVVAVSGSIAAYKTAELVSKLTQNNFDVQVIGTPNSLRFVGEATWEGLTSRPALIETFEREHHMDHIKLARWADVFLYCPASANAIGSLANGLGHDLPSTLYMALEPNKPKFVAPAMNTVMWQNAAVQRNLEKLRSDHVQIIEPAEGHLACGETGPGRLAGVDEILKRVSSPCRGKIMITAGATREAIDGVRYLTNFSTGATGAFLANYFSSRGWSVTHLHGIGAEKSFAKQIAEFSDFNSLKEKLQTLLREDKYDAVLHAAAVSDYSIEKVETDGEAVKSMGQKLSSNQHLRLDLKPNPKLLYALKEWSPITKVVGFKLTATENLADRARSVEIILDHSQIDAVVHNDLTDITQAAHKGAIHQRGLPATGFSTKAELAEKLERMLQ